jgi:hypothetical protein
MFFLYHTDTATRLGKGAMDIVFSTILTPLRGWEAGVGCCFLYHTVTATRL